MTTIDDVADCIEAEGFDYAFRSYSSFKEVRDEKFHQLRQAYVQAANELEKYIQDNCSEERDW